MTPLSPVWEVIAWPLHPIVLVFYARWPTVDDMDVVPTDP